MCTCLSVCLSITREVMNIFMIFWVGRALSKKKLSNVLKDQCHILDPQNLFFSFIISLRY